MAKNPHPAYAAVAEVPYKPSTVSPSPHPAAVAAAQTRRKAAGTKPWLVVSETGESHLEAVGKHAIMRRTGLSGRDLRILDPMLSYPSTVRGRERAIVVKLEHIKAIITATEAIVPNPRDRTVVVFVDELQRRLSNFYPAAAAAAAPPSQQAADADYSMTGAMNKGIWAFTPSPSDRGKSQSPIRNEDEDGLQHVSDMSKALGPKSLPFEFRVLEVCLESACRCLETETVVLEKEAYPALDELTSKISTLNLERVRQIKSRLVAISGRVQKVRDELEHLLDDDMDMAEMYLKDKVLAERQKKTLSKGENESDDESYEDHRSRFRRMSDRVGYKPNSKKLQMLLEAYFVQIEGTLNKLSAMREYVDDTEDYINIMLDDKQNQLRQMGVMLSTTTLIISAGIVVVGMFGMNIHIELFGENVNPIKFWETAAGTVAGCLVLYFIAVVWGKKQGLLA